MGIIDKLRQVLEVLDEGEHVVIDGLTLGMTVQDEIVVVGKNQRGEDVLLPFDVSINTFIKMCGNANIL